MLIFAMSDIHGEIGIFEETFNSIVRDNLISNKENKLIILGDYLSRHHRDSKVLYYFKELQESYKNQIILLMGNHELIFLEDIENQIISFNDKNMLSWIKSLPFYYETDTQIFVHAGIDEEAGEYWKWGVEDYYFCFKYPHSLGRFYKDIIAGHIFTSEITGNIDYHRIYWDGANHFYIDGQTEKSGVIPVLEFDNQTNSYLGYEKIIGENRKVEYVKYHIK